MTGKYKKVMISTDAAQSGMPIALRLFGSLLSRLASGIHARLRRLATKPYKLSGLVIPTGCLCLALAANGTFTAFTITSDADVIMDSKGESIKINGVPYVHGQSKPVQLVTDEIFRFEVLVKNTGTTTWGKFPEEGEHGASLLSRGDPSHDINDYNETFGAFFIIYPQQFGIPTTYTTANSPRRLPGESWPVDTFLRAPGTEGAFTMRWQTAQYPIGQERGFHHLTETRTSARNNADNYFNRPFFGEEIVVDFEITKRTEQAPPPPARRSGVLDQFDFQYEGSFAMPQLWTSADDNIYGLEDAKSRINTGITLRNVEVLPGQWEKRMLAMTGTNAIDGRTRTSRLYEIALPSFNQLGKIIGTDTSAVPTAEVRTIFSGQSNLLRTPDDPNVVSWEQGGLWYNQENNTLYWTNYPFYTRAALIDTQSVYSAKLINGEVVNTKIQSAVQHEFIKGPYVKMVRGITGIPESISKQYFGGRKLAIGFGDAWNGPSFMAASISDNDDIINDFWSVYYDEHVICSRESDDEYPLNVRDGNYLPLEYFEKLPESPWKGASLRKDSIRSGVFIDYAGKKGYLTFPRQSIGRVAYDFSGPNFFGNYQDTWYFYDLEELSMAAAGKLTTKAPMPSSYSVVEYPTNRPTLDYEDDADDRIVTGSCFDSETGLLYIYVKRGKNGADPLVHVYSITEGDEYAPYINGGQKTMLLSEGYNAASSLPFTITANPTTISVNIITSTPQITWNSTTKTIDIAPGITAGIYNAEISASNGIGSPTVFTFSLIVNPSTSKFVPPLSQEVSRENKRSCPLSLFLIPFLLFIALKGSP